jgi:diaminopimelate decarboxylase
MKTNTQNTYDTREICDAVQAILTQAPPLLSKKELDDFVGYFFNRREEYLDMLSHHPSPLYLLEPSVLRDRALHFKKAFQAVFPSVGFYFAVKSNNHPDVAETLLKAGYGLDVSSGAELETALAHGAQDIIFSGPGKTDAELRLAVEHPHQVAILIDSFGELDRLVHIAEMASTRIRCGVRLCVDPNGLWRKFGIPVHDLASFREQSSRFPRLELIGLQFHCSWNRSPDQQVAFINALGNVLTDMPDSFKNRLEFIDIGGGYWPPQGEWLLPAGTPAGRIQAALGLSPLPVDTRYRLPAVPIEAFAEKIGRAVQKHVFNTLSCRICLEPGRWICNDAVHLVMTVIDKKDPDLVITDAGTNMVGWERFETDYFPVLNLTRPSLHEKPCHILGSLCTPHDVWGYAYFGEDIQPGDILMIPTQGAYTYSLRQYFIKPVPPVRCMRTPDIDGAPWTTNPPTLKP